MVLLDVVLAGWRQYIAEEIVSRAFEQHKNVDVIWAASDEMVLGVLDAVKQFERILGRDFVVGFFDWNADVIQKIVKGDVVASFGGQFFEGGLALVLLYDYHHGLDFADSLGTSISTPMYSVTSKNVNEYLAKLDNVDWNNIDFRQFSKTLNLDLKRYDFSLDAVLGVFDRKL